jgi:Family of unknown function (DUF6325)
VTEIGPVQLMSIGFEPGARFEGRIVDELAKLESERTIRILDLLFIARDPESEKLVLLEHQEESMGAIVAAMLGLVLDGEEEQEHSFGFSSDEIADMAAGLDPGAAAGLILIEHVWARDLKRAIRDAGGRPLADALLTPEAVAAVEPKLAAMSDLINERSR